MPRQWLEAMPAYGRDYTSAKAVKADWDNEKDFQIVTIGEHYGRYINKPQLTADMALEIRYQNGRKVIVFYGSE